MTIWARWARQPQSVWLRKALFQVHVWVGLGVGLYMVAVSVTGAVLVYRIELARAFTPEPIVVTGAGERLTDEQLKAAALAVYPGYAVRNIFRSSNLDQAVDVWLARGDETRQRLFDPYTGADLRESVPLGIRSVTWFLDLHDNLLNGPTGRMVNGFGGLFLILLGLTGIVIWWPGIQKWRRSLTIHRNGGWKRLTWDLHGAIGFWALFFVLMFGISGAYLAFPEQFALGVDFLEPPTDENLGYRVGDTVLTWLSRMHFGRFGGGLTKVLWTIFGLAPVVLFGTGAVIWWNRSSFGKRAARAESTVFQTDALDRDAVA